MHTSILVKRYVPRIEQPDILGLTLGLIIHVKLKNKILIVRNMSTADAVQIWIEQMSQDVEPNLIKQNVGQKQFTNSKKESGCKK